MSTLAVWKFASCDGCQLSILDCEEELLPLAGDRRRRLSPAIPQCGPTGSSGCPVATSGAGLLLVLALATGLQLFLGLRAGRQLHDEGGRPIMPR